MVEYNINGEMWSHEHMNDVIMMDNNFVKIKPHELTLKKKGKSNNWWYFFN
jgi:hypothetical protein